MIEVRCLASGSTGNSYSVDDGVTVLLLEAGIPAKKMMAGYLDLLPRVEGCLITHEHGDHAKAACDLPRRGIDVYMTAGTAKEFCSPLWRPVRGGSQFQFGTWMILPFETEHDSEEPVGYLLYSTAAREKLLFATDTYYIPNTFRELNVIMVECNYSPKKLEENKAAGLIPAGLCNRLEQSHFSINDVKDFLEANDLSKVRRIYLLHVSKSNGDPVMFQREIQRLTGLPVTVCGKDGDLIGSSTKGRG